MLEDKIQKISGYCSDFPSETVLWIKEAEMVDSPGELKSSRSSDGKNFPNFAMLDARTASSLQKITQNSHVKKMVNLEEQKTQKEDRFQRGIPIAFDPTRNEALCRQPTNVFPRKHNKPKEP